MIPFYFGVRGANSAFQAIFRKIDRELGEWIERETERMAKQEANGEEVPDIVLGGDILPGALYSGHGAKDGAAPSPKLAGGSLDDKLHGVLEGGHLFNLVAKGYNK